MRCPIESQDSAELLLDYCARRLDPDTAASLELHIHVCPACREFREGQKAMWQALDTWESMPITPDFDRRLYRRIESEVESGWWRRVTDPLRSLVLRPGVPLGATACLLLVGGFLLQNPGVTPLPTEPPQAVQAVQEVDQVERTLEDMEMLRQLNLVGRSDGSASVSM
ncbi:MAG: anti-sigma factor family protein [Bryobacteraceae bacterium]